MKVLTKVPALIQPGEDDDQAENGSFHVILSAPTLDRDGETLKADEWKTPLPEHITFDTDHGMSVETTVGSGVPSIDDDGCMHVRGTYSSIPRAQEVRTLVGEGHVRTTSVAFMTEKSSKSNGKREVTRELLNGSFVAVPSNREALVLSSKGIKRGARNNSNDKKSIQAIHDHAADLGASCASEGDDSDDGDTSGASEGATGGKTVTAWVPKALANSVEDLQTRLSGALDEIYEQDEDTWCWVQATFLDEGGKSGTVVYRVNGDSLSRTFTDDGTAVSLGDTVTDVALVTTAVPANGATNPDDDSSAATRSAPADQAGADKAAAELRAAKYRVLQTIHAQKGNSTDANA